MGTSSFDTCSVAAKLVNPEKVGERAPAWV